MAECGWCHRAARPPKCSWCGTLIATSMVASRVRSGPFSVPTTATVRVRGTIVHIDGGERGGFAFADFGAELRAFIRREDVERLGLRVGDAVEFQARADDRGRGLWASDVVRP